MNNGILIWAEVTRESYVHPVTFELASKAKELSEKKNNIPVTALVCLTDEPSEDFKEAFCINGFDKVFYLKSDKFKTYKSDLFAKAVIGAVQSICPEIMLIGATCQGRDLAPRISTALHTGLTADCTALDINEEGKLAATRPTFGGQLMATILSKNTPQMATVRPKVFKFSADSERKNTEFIRLDVNEDTLISNIEVVDFKKKFSSSLNEIDSAEIIVAGGRGMQSKEGFELLKQLAVKLDGVVGASRLAVEMGLADASCQVGQTGKSVCPKLYIACGISGALQHTVGIDKDTKIIAINSDKNAEIFKVANYGIVGDAFEIIPQLIEDL